MSGAGGTSFSYEVERRGPASIFRARGRIDHASAPGFSDALMATVSSGGAVVVDLSDVNHMTSAGMRSLALGRREAARVGGRLAVSAPEGIVAEVLRIGGFHHLLTICETIDAALAEIAPDGGAGASA